MRAGGDQLSPRTGFLLQLLARLAQKQMQIIFLIALAFRASSLPRNKRKKKKSHQQAAAPKPQLQRAAGCLGDPLVVPWVGTRRGWGAFGATPRSRPCPGGFLLLAGSLPGATEEGFHRGSAHVVPPALLHHQPAAQGEAAREGERVPGGHSPPPACIRGPVPRLCPLSFRFAPGGFAPRVSRLFPKGMGLCGHWPRPAGCDLGTPRLLQPTAASRSHFLPLLPSRNHLQLRPRRRWCRQQVETELLKGRENVS